MPARTIDNPGIELNEIDRSYYGKVDNSLPNSPTSLIFGFADKGQDMTLEWIDSRSTLDDTFGKPTTEFESYLYNAAVEVLNRGGTCIASKLPYDNIQCVSCNYIEYTANELCINTGNSSINASTKYTTLNDIHDALFDVLSSLQIQSQYSIGTIKSMATTLELLHKNYLSTQIPVQTINDISASLKAFIDTYVLPDAVFSLLYYNDSSLTSYVSIKLNNDQARSTMSPVDELDNYITSKARPLKGHIRIYDMTHAQYDSLQNCQCVSSDALSAYTNECLGIVPVIVSPVNAIYFQSILDNENQLSNANSSVYNCISSFTTLPRAGIHCNFENISSLVSLPLMSYSLVNDQNSASIDSLSRQAALQFPLINFYDYNHFDKTHLKKIGVVVFKAFRDSSNSGKIGFQLLESFVGQLDRNAKDPVTHAGDFIDDIVNQNSQFIKLFSNIDQSLVQRTDTYAVSLQPAASMGFYKEDCMKDISFMNSIMKPITMVLDKAISPNLVPIDLVVDAGVSNIAQIAKNAGLGKSIHTDQMPSIADYEWRFGAGQSDISGWKAVVSKLDNFCKSTRKDCMLLVDGIRAVCLDGNSKLIRPTAPQNNVTNTIIPRFKYIAHALDSSYAAGYCNWFFQQDYGRQDMYLWIPPSIKAMGVCIYCDTYFHPWSAPAGNVRGIIGDAVDVAFLPTDVDAGVIYSNSWNYAMSYPLNGIVIEGHKTFQSQRTALDRINVRRLMLSLEKNVADVARNFVYEQNTPYMRQQFVDNITPILEAAVAGSGISEYAIKCDDELNTPQVIDNNELHCKIAVKPVKVVDYIVLSFICTNQSVNVNEEVVR